MHASGYLSYLQIIYIHTKDQRLQIEAIFEE